jgi:hypothetical protein
MLRSRGAKRARLIAEERIHSPSWFYLSFATDYEFLGAAVVRAQGFLTAVQRASNLGINPRGDVMCQGPILRKGLHGVPAALRNRLLTEAEVRRHLDGKRVSE